MHTHKSHALVFYIIPLKSEIELKFDSGITVGITVVGVDHTAGPAALEGEFWERGAGWTLTVPPL